MKRLALMAMLCPALAVASECEHGQDRSLALDLEGVRTVRIEINGQALRLARSGSDNPRFTARACASDPALFDQLKLTQQRQGDTLVIRAERDGYSSGIFFQSNYATLQLDAQLPATLAYEVRVGSGDVSAFDSGALDVASVGSGDLEVRGVRGEATVGDIGSGDVDIHTVGRSLRVEAIGSGDLTVTGVDGRVAIGSIGSGDADITDVGEGLSVRRIGSGDVSHRDVRGPVDLPTRD